ncbi:TetR/AcrR family transcriptional regulator [Mycobacterium sp. CBMA271]|uniref:TetR/AcrR family transcriptional regulator n=1 Tax=unclassified Mycobacteroides TaxID=2618759 RepID=UPI0012DBDD9A|nr:MULTISPECIES: TetR/AcrR family transcriptional regulator [unclassified Mycobacteroides]MUM17145.1 TetR family transcriptional regulator [Mycobacteroides sp. CBMA 326]MUM23815.1 TetR/AcrR family transcriptional regulator [Mycobacteroides sp. CBMA 271]
MSSTRLSAEDWLHAGFDILAAEGLRELKIETLSTRLGVTKGSFYWHFSDIEAYRSALIGAWGDGLTEDHQEMQALADLLPRERLTTMMSMLMRPRQWALERSMREWARTNQAAAEGVRASDRRVLRAARSVFTDSGFDPDTARLRAEFAFAVGAGYLYLGPRGSERASDSYRAALVDLLLKP